MNKLSIKLGTYFLLLALCIESVLFVSFHTTLAQMRVDEETTALLEKGNWYCNIIEKRYREGIFERVATMESNSPAHTKLVITDTTGHIIGSSDAITKDMRKQLDQKITYIPRGGMITEDRWKESKYISTVSPIVKYGVVTGYVHMFLETTSIKEMIFRLTKQFITIGALTVALTTILVFLFSRVITNPLIKMKRATEKMMKQNEPITLGIKSKDELGSLAETIERLSSELTYMKKERNEFLASVAHELLTPLTYVKGYTKVAKRESLSKEEREEYLQIIEEETENITELVQDLFELAQLEQHQFTIKKQPIVLLPFAERMVEKIKPSLKKKQIDISLYCQEDLYACIDDRRMEQVMLNLLHNAHQHSHENSHITVLVLKKEHTFLIQVQDEGEGIPSEDLPHIFDRFYRVDKSRTRATGGKGIGLAVAKEIVELHGGSIHVTSEVGIGTTFTIELPIK
ncbi:MULTISPECIES: HAMP domain-containing sensor histidine kinase [unclassified Bacillus (in: firmicutes)]|uniref:HAMP domain-containing sensor histidine kinase n=1 Tax=unclassified Bacillus (in: firmicutes) TaxID=185979 RepID=UPI0008DEB769|nr:MULTISPECIES: HAMP domain-containing sensor histidine kinase [unclassified Bacillus (in: firmicutes)]SFJ86299.1 HAMP domain-containing protein [Bacillus sp. 71mf]SFT06149.1 HAMP domain-containing protein [Bacillus sp. 103mf]